MTTMAIIPARYASTRFPGKPLADIGGEPMIWHVYNAAARAFGRDATLVATDDECICRAVTSRGGRAVVTPRPVDNGSARCLQALEITGERPDVIVNVQGDEPFIEPDDLTALAACFADPDVEIATMARRFGTDESPDVLLSADNPKVVMSSDGNAMYFSRSVIPAVRGASALPVAGVDYFIHVGLYAFRATTLRELMKLGATPLETAEKLEQLRWLESGYPIKVVLTRHRSVSVDTPADLERARLLFDRLK